MTARRRRLRLGAVPALLLVGVPVVIAVVGPWLVGAETPPGLAYSTEGVFGTDFVGRPVAEQVLLGGRSVVLVAVTATLLAYVVGVPVGLLTAMTRRRWVDEAIMRSLDVVLAIPTLLLLILLAVLLRPGPATMVLVIALLHLPDIARVVRAAASEVAAGPALEALRMQGETWWRTAIGLVGRSAVHTVAADAGTRLTGSLYLVASASFLGVGVAPDASDWAVMVDRNRGGLFVAPWGVVLAATLIVALSVGANLLADRALGRRTAP